MKDMIFKCIENKQVVSIYTDTDSFKVGVIIACDDEKILLNHISPDGLYDGMIALFI